MPSRSRWTALGSVTILAAVADLAVVVWWFAGNPTAFDQISGVTKVLWAAFLAVTTTFGVRLRGKRERTWAVVFGTRPVPLLVWGLTAYTFGAVAVSWLSSAAVHVVALSPPDSLRGNRYQLRIVPAPAARTTDTVDFPGTGVSRHPLHRGDYVVTVEFDQYDPDSTGVHLGLFDGLLSPVPIRLSQRLSPKSGTILISAIPRGVHVAVHALGRTHIEFESEWRGPDPFRVSVAPGPYWVSGRRDSYVADSLNVEVLPGKTSSATVVLGRAAPARSDRGGETASPKGLLVVDITPPGLAITLDGVATGRFTPDSLRLPAARYTVGVHGRDSPALTSRLGYFADFPMRVDAGDRAVLMRQLELRPLWRVRVADASAADAQYILLLNGEEHDLDVTTRTSGFYLPPGRYVIERRLNGRSLQKTVDVTGNMTITFSSG